MKTVLAPIGSSTDYGALRTALNVARALNAHVQACHVGKSVLEAALAAMPRGPGGRLAGTELGDRWHQLRNDERSAAADAKQYFLALCEKSRIPLATTPSRKKSVTGEWLETGEEDIDTVATQIVKHALYSDLVVLRSAQDTARVDLIGELLLHAGRPLLLCNDETLRDTPQHVLVAWKPTAQAARAVSVAMPLLRLAQKVTIAMATEGSMDAGSAEPGARRLAASLAWNGVQAETHIVQDGDSAPYDGVLSLVLERGIDLLVMGAYGHSRIRELILGGFTRRVLQQTPVATLLMH
jgi:nucleotide-binding universal stress UspA family protein